MIGAGFHVELTPDGVDLGDVRRVEIRCCCNPHRLYGWLPFYGGEPRMGHRLRFSVPPRFVDRVVGPGAVDTAAAGGEVLLEVATVTLGTFCSLRPRGAAPDFEELQRTSRLALKYHGDDLSFVEKLARLRHVPGFIPSPEARALLPDRERP